MIKQRGDFKGHSGITDSTSAFLAAVYSSRFWGGNPIRRMWEANTNFETNNLLLLSEVTQQQHDGSSDSEADMKPSAA